MKMEQYKPSHWLFLFGQCALFPEKLEGRLLSKDEFAHYIPAYSSTNELIAYLQQYERDGYFKLEIMLDRGYLEWEHNQAIMISRLDELYSDPDSPPDLGEVRAKVIEKVPLTTEDIRYLLTPALRSKTEQYLRFKITDMDKSRFSDELIAYLIKYQQDDLTTDTETDPENFKSQRVKLMGAAAKDYSKHEYKPTIKLTDVWQDLIGHKTFWELIITCHLLTDEIKIVNMGYNDTPARKLAADISSVASTGTVPFAKFEILSEEFKQNVTQHIAPAAVTNANPPASGVVTTRSYDPDSGILFFGGHEIQIVLQKSRRGKAVGETTQGGAMRKLFKDVNTLRNGVALHAIVSVRKDNFDAKKRKLVINHLDEINRKIKEATDVPKLIIHDQVNYYIDKSYLK